jgi:hypothetical protein
MVLQSTTGDDRRHVGNLIIEKDGNEKGDGSKALELGLLVEFFNPSSNFSSLSFLLRFTDDTFHESFVSQTLVIGFSLGYNGVEFNNYVRSLGLFSCKHTQLRFLLTF